MEKDDVDEKYDKDSNTSTSTSTEKILRCVTFPKVFMTYYPLGHPNAIIRKGDLT